MRTTVDLPPGLHRRVRELAEARGQSVSAIIAEMTARGLGQVGEPLSIRVDERSGFPVLSFGGPAITPEHVAELLDDE